MPVRDVVVQRPDADLAGSIWTPDAPTSRLILMHPGSGPSDRDNDILFPPIRAAFLAAGWAVASFDKRGVGGSTGEWTAADITVQAADATACLTACAAEISAGTTAMFGHSQGGWVVLEAAAENPAVDVVITNSGPGVSPRDQEIFSTRQRLREWNSTDSDAALAVMGEMFDLAAAHVSWADAESWLADPKRAGLVRRLGDSGAFLPSGEPVWRLTGDILDYDPRSAMRRLSVPLLAVFGSADDVVPVSASVESFQFHVHPELLEIAVVYGGDHRMMQPGTTEFATGYPALLVNYLR